VNLEFQAICELEKRIAKLEAAAPPRRRRFTLVKDTTTKYFVTIQTAEDAILLVPWPMGHPQNKFVQKQARRGGREGQSNSCQFARKNTTKKRGAIILTNSSARQGAEMNKAELALEFLKHFYLSISTEAERESHKHIVGVSEQFPRGVI